MIKSIFLKTVVILVLFSQSSCSKKIALHFDDKPDASTGVETVETKRIEWKKITQGFQSIKLPGGSSSISLLRLGQASDGSYWSVVKFPKGYHRADSVFLGVEEGYLMIEGVLKYSGISSPQGSYTVIPAEVARVETHTDEEAIAIARFSGKPFWVEKPKQKPIKAIEVKLIVSESNIGSSSDRDASTITHASTKVAYLKDKSQFADYQGAVIYSLTDSVIVEILEGESFPNLNKPFIIWSKRLPQ